MKRMLVLMVIHFFVLTSASNMMYGPIVGGVTTDSAVVWARFDGGGMVKVHYYDDMNNHSETPEYAIDTSKNNTVQVPLSGLVEDTRYHIEIIVDGASQTPVTSFQTFPVDNMRICVLADFKKTGPGLFPSNTFGSVAGEGCNLLFIHGDYHHLNSQSIPEKIAEIENIYDHYDVDFLGLLAVMGIAIADDDHDFGHNNMNAKKVGLRQNQTAFRGAYYPGYDEPLAETAAYHFDCGFALCVVTDLRGWRDYSGMPDGPDKSMMGDVQRQWFLDVIGDAEKPIVWFSTVPTIYNNPFDSWSMYQYELGLIQAHAVSTGATIIAVSADIHAGGIESGGNSPFVNMSVPGANLNSCRHSGQIGTWNVGTYTNDSGACQGYGVVDIKQNSILLEVKNQDGGVEVSYTVE